MTARSPTAIGFSLTGEKDVLGLWAGTGGEGATYWMGVLTYLRNRYVKDAFFVVCDGLKGLPEVIGNVWPTTTVQSRIIHLIGNTFRLASRKDWDAIEGDAKPNYTAVNAAAARAAQDELDDKWGAKYAAVIRLWDNAWEEFVPFLDYGACCEMGCRGGAEGLGFARMVRGRLLSSVRRDQAFLRPPDMRDWLPADHVVWFLLDTVDEVDTSAFDRCRRLGGVGAPGHAAGPADLRLLPWGAVIASG